MFTSPQCSAYIYRFWIPEVAYAVTSFSALAVAAVVRESNVRIRIVILLCSSYIRTANIILFPSVYRHVAWKRKKKKKRIATPTYMISCTYRLYIVQDDLWKIFFLLASHPATLRTTNHPLVHGCTRSCRPFGVGKSVFHKITHVTCCATWVHNSLCYTPFPGKPAPSYCGVSDVLHHCAHSQCSARWVRRRRRRRR